MAANRTAVRRNREAMMVLNGIEAKGGSDEKSDAMREY
jgi:hypothetical protein